MLIRWTWFVMLGAAWVLVAPHARLASAKTGRSEPITLKKGLPAAAGLGKLVVLTNFPSSDKRYKVLKAYAKSRGAKLIKFKEVDLQSVRKRLQRTGAEFVALAMTPESIDTNFHYSALEGDRGEMAMAEWEYFRQRACPVGEAMGYQYRLAFMSLPPDFTRFPRQKHMFKKRMGFYDVMLRGMVSRVLLSDPSFRPLAKPIDQRSDEAEITYDAASKQLKLTARVTRWSQGLYLNYLPKSGKGVFDRRLYVRVPLPDGAPANFGQETIKVTNGPEVVELARHHIRHEVWGGQRYLNVQVEALAGKIKSGTTMELVLPAP